MIELNLLIKSIFLEIDVNAIKKTSRRQTEEKKIFGSLIELRKKKF